MKLEWIGHACFRLTAENGTVIVTDPYDDSVGIRVPKLTADLVTVSHEHHDHNNLDIVEGRPKVAREARAAQVGGVTTQAVTSYHDDRGGALRGRTASASSISTRSRWCTWAIRAVCPPIRSCRRF